MFLALLNFVEAPPQTISYKCNKFTEVQNVEQVEAANLHISEARSFGK